MNTVAIIQARLNSTRFPGKVLADLCGVPVLKRVIDQVRKAESVDRIIVATPDASIAELCYELEWDCDAMCPPTSEEDVLGRLVYVGRAVKAELIVRVCGDNPLVDPDYIDNLVGIDCRVDYCGYRYSDGAWAITKPSGYVAEVVRLDTLEKLDSMLSPADPQREHVTQGIYTRPEMFRCVGVDTIERESAAIDTPEDLDRVAEMIANNPGRECDVR